MCSLSAALTSRQYLGVALCVHVLAGGAHLQSYVHIVVPALVLGHPIGVPAESTTVLLDTVWVCATVGVLLTVHTVALFSTVYMLMEYMCCVRTSMLISE
jgi:ABC-type proline/glycine betaine transport system permease subunit